MTPDAPHVAFHECGFTIAPEGQASRFARSKPSNLSQHRGSARCAPSGATFSEMQGNPSSRVRSGCYGASGTVAGRCRHIVPCRDSLAQESDFLTHLD